MSHFRRTRVTIVLLYRLWVEAVSLQLQVLALRERLPLVLAPPALPTPAMGLFPDALRAEARAEAWTPTGEDWLLAYV